MKDELDIEGRTIRVADKGLDCALNIYETDTSKDGYIFSKSVRKLSDAKKVWVLSEKDVTEETELAAAGWKFVKDSNGKIMYRYKIYISTEKEKISYVLKKGTILKPKIPNQFY